MSRSPRYSGVNSTHGLELRDCSFCIAGVGKTARKNLLSDSRENTHPLHTTSNALLRRAVLALGEPDIVLRHPALPAKAPSPEVVDLKNRSGCSWLGSRYGGDLQH